MNHNKEESIQYTMSQIKDAISELYTLAYNEGRTVDGQKILDIMTEEYQKGLDDAWECAKKIALQPSDGGFSITQLELVFNQTSVASILSTYSASEAIAKIKEYEEKKKADEEIKVGDEVMVDERRMIVLGIDSGGWKQLWCPFTGLVLDNVVTSEMTKTGRHFDIQSLLDQMKGE